MGRNDHHSAGFPGPEVVSALAAEQRGLVTTEQLRELGFTRGRRESWLRSGRLHPVYRGVYALGRPMLSQQGRWLAAVLACGPGAVLSHRCAGALWEIIVAAGDLVEVSAPRSRDGRRDIVVHRPVAMPRSTVLRGIPVTTLEQTLEDLARTFTDGALRRAVAQAELRPEFDGAALSSRVWARVDPDGDDARDANVLQDLFLRICRRARLGMPEREVPWGRWVLDFLWREQGVAVETDGRAAHTRRTQFARDREKDRDLLLAGLLPLRFTYGDVRRRADMVAATCRTALTRPGCPSL